MELVYKVRRFVPSLLLFALPNALHLQMAYGQTARQMPATRSAATQAGTGQPAKPQPNENPITAINVSLPANPDANTANWGTGGDFAIETVARPGGKIRTDVAQGRMLVVIQQNGRTVCGGATATNQSGGFQATSKTWTGTNAKSLLGNGCTLPPGNYELRVQMVGTAGGKDTALSPQAIKPFTIRGNDQQALRTPVGGAAVPTQPQTRSADASTSGGSGAGKISWNDAPTTGMNGRVQTGDQSPNQNGNAARQSSVPMVRQSANQATAPLVRLGQTSEQVRAELGPPARIAAQGAKSIFFYNSGARIIFTSGRVTSVE